jgi:ABC-type antimicrobial peptide transport system ATPase subunit
VFVVRSLFLLSSRKRKKNVSLCTTLFRRRPVVCVTPSMAINSQWSIGGLGYDIRWKKKKRVFWNL